MTKTGIKGLLKTKSFTIMIFTCLFLSIRPTAPGKTLLLIIHNPSRSNQLGDAKIKGELLCWMFGYPFYREIQYQYTERDRHVVVKTLQRSISMHQQRGHTSEACPTCLTMYTAYQVISSLFSSSNHTHTHLPISQSLLVCHV